MRVANWKKLDTAAFGLYYDLSDRKKQESWGTEAVLNTVKQAKPQNLEQVQLFDVFRGRNVPAGQKSMAYAFTYRSPDRTLTDAEVNAAHEKLLEQLKRTISATIREA